MSIIEEALRDAEAESQKERMQEEGYEVLADRLPEKGGGGSGLAPWLRIGALAAGVLLVAAGGWWAYGQISGGGAEVTGPAGGEMARAGGPGSDGGGPASPAGGGDGTAAGARGSGAAGAAGAGTDTAGTGRDSGLAAPESRVAVAGRDSFPSEAARPSAGGAPSTSEEGGEAAPADEVEPRGAERGDREEAEQPSGAQQGEDTGAEQPAPESDPAAEEPERAAARESADPPDEAPEAETGAPRDRAERESPAGEGGAAGDEEPGRADSVVSVSAPTDSAGEAGADIESDASDDPRKDDERARRLFREASSLAEAGDTEGAVARYRKAIAADSTYVGAYSNLGVLLTEEGRYREAARVLRAGLRTTDGRPGLAVNLAITHLEAGDPGRAVEALREVIAGGDAPVEAYVNLGLAYRQLSRLEPAETALRTALDRDRGNGMAHYNLARVLEAQGRTAEAITHYSRFLESGTGSHRLRVRVQTHVDRLRTTLP